MEKPFLEEDLSPGSLAKELYHLLLGESHQNVQNPTEGNKNIREIRDERRIKKTIR